MTVTEVKETKEEVHIRTAEYEIRAKYVVMATHIPIGFHPVQTVAAAYRSYVVAAKLTGSVYPDAYYWHNDGIHHAITTHGAFGPEPDFMMIAGAHHRTGQAEDQDYLQYFKKIQDYFGSHAHVQEYTQEWSAQHYQSGDGVPYIGASPGSRQYIATGFYADGLTYGTVAGLLISDLIQGKENAWSEAYHVGRLNLTTVENFIRDSLNVAGEYVKEIVFKGDVKHFDQINRGEGRTIEADGQKLAAYRDEKGELQVVSAVCTHLKCIVNWNNAMKTWDCPCHGSRFMTDGTVIEGPAIMNLTKIQVNK